MSAGLSLVVNLIGTILYQIISLWIADKKKNVPVFEVLNDNDLKSYLRDRVIEFEYTKH